MVYQDPLTLSPAELVGLELAAHKEPYDFVKGLLLAAYQAYRVGTILILVCVVGNRLQLLAVQQEGKPGAYFHDLADRLRELARAWGCPVIDSSTTSARVAGLLSHVGATVASVEYHMELEV
jgi:hypothetical protein